MSTIKVNSIKNTSTDDGGIAIDNSGHVQIDGQQLPTAGALSNRNLVANGAFQVDQRNSGSSITIDSGGTTSGFAADRAKFFVLGTGELDLTLQQVTDAPAGFRNSVKATVATAESSGATPASNDRASMQIRLEGNAVESLALGTSDAKNFIVSFYVKSSLTGNFGLAFIGTDRSYPVLYNIASADTWERKVIKVPGPTDGTWGTGSSLGLALKFGFYTGSDRDGPDQGTAGTGTWQTNATPQGVENQVQIGGTASATWQITGVQLEVGEKATPFEHRSFGDELARCQRYFCKSSTYSVFPTAGANHDTAGMFFASIVNSYTSNAAYSQVFTFPVPMRTTPGTIVTYGTQLGSTTTTGQVSIYDSSGGAWRSGTTTIHTSTDKGFNLSVSGTWGAGSNLFFGAFTASSEL